MISTNDIRVESRAMLRLASPVIIAQLSQMSMGFVDIMLVSRLGSEPLAAVGIGNALFYVYLVFAFGVITAVGPMVAQAHGAGDEDEIGRAVGSGLWLSIALAMIGMLIYWNAEAIFLAAGQAPRVAAMAESYTRAMSFALLPNLLFSTFRAFTDGLGRTRVAMIIAFPSIFINAFGDYALMYGEFGFPNLGVAGCGYATSFMRWCMLAMMLYFIMRTPELRRYRFLDHVRSLNLRHAFKTLRLGLPIGAGHSMENGFFGLTSLFMGQISTIAVAAHQVAINVAAFTFMVPLSIGIATSTRVGHAIGRREPEAARIAGWVGIIMAGLFMCLTALMMVLFAKPLISIYSPEAEVAAYATVLLAIAGAFQLFDGIQVAAMGALRGMKDTSVPLITNLLAYWVVGMPISYLLAFEFGLGGPGLWWGVTAGLAIASVLHTLRFSRRVRTAIASSEEPVLDLERLNVEST